MAVRRRRLALIATFVLPSAFLLLLSSWVKGRYHIEPPPRLGPGARAAAVAALRAVLEGKPGAFRNVALLNSAAALVVAGKATNLKDGVALGTKSLDSGAAMGKLQHLIKVSHA